MYRWYKEAQVCYAYLADVTSHEDPHSLGSGFAKSRWFTRGWTLQELIAPSSVEFYGKDWDEIGTKLSLQKLVSVITGVPVTALKFGDMESFSVAQRMSWASKRQTTRVEDKAYCLMGLFGVNMPMLYGEGDQAFGRLQEEIMKTSDDHTLFAWTERTPDKGRWITRGLLANSPTEFSEAGDISQSDPILKSDPYSLTNKGLRIELPLFPIGNQVHFAVLYCQRSTGVNDLHGIFLQQHSSGKEEYFSRRFTDIMDTIQKEKVHKLERRTLYIIRKSVEDRTPRERGLPFRIFLDMKVLRQTTGYHFSKAYAGFNEWTDLEDGSFLFYGQQTCIFGVFMFEGKNKEAFVVAVGHYEGLPWCDVLTDIGKKTLERVYQNYLGELPIDPVDRISKPLGAGISVSVSIRKQQGKQITSEDKYDGEYTVQISSLEGQGNRSTSNVLSLLRQQKGPAIFQQLARPTMTMPEKLNNTEISRNDIVIPVMGLSGAGKTTFIQLFAKERLEIGFGLESCTQNPEIHECYLPSGEKIMLVDMPGFGDSSRSDEQVLLEITDWLQTAYQQGILLSGIIYLHPISDARISKTATKNLRMFKKLCGSEALRRVVVATTFWGMVPMEVGAEREEHLLSMENFLGPMMRQGTAVVRHDGGIESACRIVEYLKATNVRSSLEIQIDVVERGLLLNQTAAGREVQDELKWLRDREIVDEKMAQEDRDLQEQLAKEESRTQLRKFRCEQHAV